MAKDAFRSSTWVALLAAASMAYSQILTALFGAFLGAYLGASDYGVINLARSIFVVVLFATPLGLDLALQRSLAHDPSAGPDPAGRVNWLRLITASIAAGIAIIFFFGGAYEMQVHLFPYPGFARVLAITMLALPFATDTAVLGGAYRGLRQPTANILTTYVIQPTFRMLLVIPLFLFVDRVTAAAVGTSGSFIVAGLWMIFVARKTFPFRGLRGLDGLGMARSILAYSPVLGMTTLMFAIARSLDTITLAHYAPSREVGRYGIVVMVGQLVGVIGTSSGQTLGSRVAAAAQSGNRARVAELLRLNMSLTSILCAPFCVAIALWGSDVDLVLGKTYIVPMQVFIVASITQWMMTTTHNASYGLSLTGRHGLEFRNNVVFLTVQIIACIALVPSFGMLGAALSAAISILALNAMRQFQIADFVGETIFRPVLLRPLLLSAIAAVPWYVLHHAIGFRAWWLTGLVASGHVMLSFLLIYFFSASSVEREQLAEVFTKIVVARVGVR